MISDHSRFDALRDEIARDLAEGQPLYIQAGLKFTPLPLPNDDLAHQWKCGHVAPDGSIWGDEPTVRWMAGLVRVTPEEAVKAERFGWERVGPPHPLGYVDVRRAHIA